MSAAPLRVEPGSRLAVITGAGSGFGRAISLALAGRGWQVWVTDLDAANARETLAMILDAGGSGQAHALDVTRQGAWKDLTRQLASSGRHLDLLVNNAGIASSGKLGQLPLELWERVMQVNYWGCVYGLECMLPLLEKNPHGARILNVASYLGFVNGPRMGAYSVSKAALIAFSENLWCDLHGSRVSVTLLCPGFFPSGLSLTNCFTNAEEREFINRKMRKSRLTTDKLVQQALLALERRKFYVIVPVYEARLVWWCKRLMPRTFLRLARNYEARCLPKVARASDAGAKGDRH